MLQRTNNSNKHTDLSTKLSAESLLSRIQKQTENQWNAHCRGLTLSSVFQPIISLHHRRVVGHEALLRTHDSQNKIVSPALLFNSRENIGEIIELDRLCRTLHSANYQQHSQEDRWLFLNINPEVINHGHIYGDFFSELLNKTSIQPSQVVVEVLENQVSEETLLRERIDYYRQMGCLIAIDDFGAGHSNIDRVLHMEPEIVKLDRSLLLNTSAKAKRILSNLVALLHEAGCLVVLECIETLEQALLAYEIDVDMVQGYFFSKPGSSPIDLLPDNFFSNITDELEKHQETASIFRQNTLSSYHHIFQQSVFNYESGIDFPKAIKKLLDTSGVQRAYIMDEDGYLINDNLCSKNFEKKLKPQMAPMHHSSGANLSNRHYFQRAKNNPGQTQMTRPYLSATDAELCITLSHGIKRADKNEVVCCDLKVPESI